MASIQSLGAGSGLLTSSLVDDIVASERAVTDLRIQSERFAYEAEVSAFGSLRSATQKLQDSVRALNDPTAFNKTSGSVSDPGVVGISVANTADIGSHSIEVTQLASAQVIASGAFADVNSATGTGELTFRFGTTTFTDGSYDTFTVNPDVTGGTVTIDQSNNTLSGVRDAINDADLGVNATLLDDGNGIRLVLTSADSGEDLSMEVVVAEGGSPGLSAFAFNAAAATPGANMEQTVTAADAQLKIDGINLSRSNNTVTGALAGVTLTLKSTNAGAPAALSVSRNTDGVVSLVDTFVNDFNALLELTGNLTAFDPETKEAGLLLGDATVRSVLGQLRRALNEQVTELGGGTAQSLLDVGVSTDQSDGFRLKFDAAALTSALNGNANAVAGLFAEFGFSSSPSATFLGTSPLTQPGKYDYQVLQPASQGFARGAAAALSGPINIDADNDGLTLTVNGITSDPISLTQGSYADGEALAEELETQINADAKLGLGGGAVTVTYDAASSRLQITSERFGAGSQVAIDSVDANMLADLGLGVDDGEATAGLDVAGRIDGINAAGVDQVLTLSSNVATAASGQFRSGVSAADAGAVTLDATNNNFSIVVDGVTSGTITLTEGAYADGAALATELQTQINADATLAGGSKSVSVAYSANTGRFTITSDVASSASSISLAAVPAATDAIFAFGAGNSFDGYDARTSISAAAGLSLKTLGSAAGSTGNVTFTEGVMAVFSDVLKRINGSDGSIDSRLDSLDARLADLDEEAVKFNTRMNAFQERLRSQFAAADALISQLNSTADFLLQQVALLPLSNLNNN